MDRRTLIAIGVCFLVFLGWQNFFGPKNKNGALPSAQTTAVQNTAASTEVKNKDSAVATAHQSREFSIQNATVKISNDNAAIEDWLLQKFKVNPKNETKIDLQSVAREKENLFFGFDLQEYVYLNQVRGNLTEKSAQELVWNYQDKNVEIEKKYQINPDRAFIDIVLTARFKQKKPNYAFVSIIGRGLKDDPEARDSRIAHWANDKINDHPLHDKVELTPVADSIKWIATMNRYFVFAVIPQGAFAPTGVLQPAGELAARMSLAYPMSGDTISIPLRVFFGPKDLAVLHSVEPTLDHTVDFGWFTLIAYPLLRLMKWFYQFFHNYGIAIILLTFLVKLLTLPLTYRSMKSMKEMSRLQPQLKKLQEKYKDDREALNREMLTFMRSHGYNPMAGCWPILIQMPIFFALYRVLYSSVELYQAPFGLWLHDLSAKDPYYVMPILVTIVWFLQQKLSPQTSMDPAQQKIMQFMPIIFGIFMLTLPSGLGIYFLVNALLSIVQQIVLNKKLGTGQTTLVAKSK